MKKYLSITIISLLVFSAFFFAFDKSGAEKMKNKKGSHTMNDENINDKEFKTESGLIYEIIKLGEGEKPNATDKVEVHYHGTLEDGSVFDSSVDRNQTITFGLNQVIKGWTEGLQLMPVGSKFKFTIPPELGYGDRDMGSIPPNSTLIFEVELFDIKKPFVDKDFSLPAEEIATESGLRYLEHIAGDGEVTQTGNVVVVHYSGFLSDGTKFDSSHDRARPFNFTLGENRVIKGWEEGLLNMKKRCKKNFNYSS